MTRVARFFQGKILVPHPTPNYCRVDGFAAPRDDAGTVPRSSRSTVIFYCLVLPISPSSWTGSALVASHVCAGHRVPARGHRHRHLRPPAQRSPIDRLLRLLRPDFQRLQPHRDIRRLPRLGIPAVPHLLLGLVGSGSLRLDGAGRLGPVRAQRGRLVGSRSEPRRLGVDPVLRGPGRRCLTPEHPARDCHRRSARRGAHTAQARRIALDAYRSQPFRLEVMDKRGPGLSFGGAAHSRWESETPRPVCAPRTGRRTTRRGEE